MAASRSPTILYNRAIAKAERKEEAGFSAGEWGSEHVQERFQGQSPRQIYEEILQEGDPIQFYNEFVLQQTPSTPAEDGRSP